MLGANRLRLDRDKLDELVAAMNRNKNTDSMDDSQILTSIGIKNFFLADVRRETQIRSIRGGERDKAELDEEEEFKILWKTLQPKSLRLGHLQPRKQRLSLETFRQYIHKKN